MTTGAHVVVDALSVHFGGGATYLTEQLAALEDVAPEVELRVLAGPWNARGLAAAIRSPVEVVHVRDGLGRLVWEQTMLGLKHVPNGVLYSPGGTAPLAGCRLPVVLALQNPNYFGQGLAAPHNQLWNRRLRTWLLRRSTRQADHVIVVSESFGREVLADLPELAGRLTVIPSGSPSLPAAERAPDGIADDLAFFVCLANDAPHKQLDLLVASWSDAMRHRSPADAVALVLAGHVPAARRQEHRALVDPTLVGHLVHLGAVVDRRQIVWLLRRARALVTASSLESFGFTPAEAGLTGCPVIATDIPAHREVAGDHAHYVPAGDREALAAALRAAPPDPPRPLWRWPVTWTQHARQLAAVLTQIAERRQDRAA
jgi:glycosyltransferase involved in cell wall biosynthesis